MIGIKIIKKSSGKAEGKGASGLSGLSRKLDKAVFDDLFEKVENGADADGNTLWAIKAKYGLFSSEWIATRGMAEDGGAAGGLDIAMLEGYLSDNAYLARPAADTLYQPKGDYLTAAALSGYATRSWVESKGYLTRGDIAGLATSASVKAVSDRLDDFLTGSDTDNIINKWKELEAFLSGMAETDNLASLLGGKVDKVAGYGLSKNDFTDSYRSKLDSLVNYTLPAAKADVLGGVMIGSSLSISSAGLLNLPETVTAGTYAKVSVDRYGRVTAGAALSESDIPALGGYYTKSESDTRYYTKTEVDNGYVRAGVVNSGDLNTVNPTASFIKSVNVSANAPNGNGWYNVIQLAHRNGLADGGGYVGQIALGMTVSHEQMFFRTHRTRAWQSVLTSNNYSAHLDSRYLRLSGGTMANADLVANLNADLLDGYHANGLFTALSRTGSHNNTISATVGGATRSAGLYPISSWGIRHMYKSDNAGRPTIFLIADITSWKGSASGASQWGFTGRVTETRAGGYIGEKLTDVICRCGYSDSPYTNTTHLRTSNDGHVSPKVIQHNGKYYLGLLFNNSGHDVIMEGFFHNCLPTFIELQCGAGGALPSGASDVTASYESYAYSEASVASATKWQTARRFWGQLADGTDDVSGDMTGVGSITMSGELKIGDAVLSWDAANKAIKVTKGLYSTEFIATRGASDSSGGGAGMDVTALAQYLADNRYATQPWVTSTLGNYYTKTAADSRFLTQHQSLANYVTLNTAQTITGVKTFGENAWVLKSNESNEIKGVFYNNGTLGQGAAQPTLNAIRHGLDFRWYDTHWVIGNVRGGSTDSMGFGITLRNADNKLDLGLLVTKDRVFAGGYAVRGGTAAQFLMADGSVKALSDITGAYVTALGTSGNYLTWTKNGVASNITVPYAANADTVDGIHANKLMYSFGGTEADPASYDGNYAGMTTKSGIDTNWWWILSHGYGSGNNVGNKTWVAQLALPTQGRRGIRYRTGKNASEYGEWVTVLDSVNFDSVIGSNLTAYVKKSGDTMTGPLTVNYAGVETGISIYRQEGAGAFIRYYNNNQTTNYFRAGMYANGYFGISYNSEADAFAVTASGNVGIGTTSPAYRLDVNGSIIADSWIRTRGNTGWYSETYGGGWYMSDTTWVRLLNDKSLYAGSGIIRTDGSLQVGANGSKFLADSTGAVSAASLKIGSGGYFTWDSANKALKYDGSLYVTGTLSCRGVSEIAGLKTLQVEKVAFPSGPAIEESGSALSIYAGSDDVMINGGCRVDLDGWVYTPCLCVGSGNDDGTIEIKYNGKSYYLQINKMIADGYLK